MKKKTAHKRSTDATQRNRKPVRKASPRKRATRAAAQGAIEAKPTTYAGIQFKSRLEAKWAVFLDYHPSVSSWQYEPRTFKSKTKGWTYTPDFLVKIGVEIFGWMEVKPVVPTNEHLAVLHHFVPKLPGRQAIDLILAYGSFWDKEVPFLYNIPDTGPPPTREDVQAHSHKLLDIFFGGQDAIKTAMSYRFDLPEERPKWKRRGTIPPWRQ